MIYTVLKVYSYEKSHSLTFLYKHVNCQFINFYYLYVIIINLNQPNQIH